MKSDQDNYLREGREESFKLWQKVLSILFPLAGVIFVIIAIIKKQSNVLKSAIIYTVIGLALTIVMKGLVDMI